MLLAGWSNGLLIEDSNGISAEDSPEYQHLLNEYNQLQQDFQDYVDRNSNNCFATQAKVDEMRGRFSGFETKKRELMGDGVTVKNTMAKGLWIGTENGGLHIYRHTDKSFLGEHSRVNDVATDKDDKTIYLAKPDGVYYLEE